MNRIITTTTDTLDGYTIEEYHESITANVVVGSNVFSDFAAGWTDFFGGGSSTYIDTKKRCKKNLFLNEHSKIIPTFVSLCQE